MVQENSRRTKSKIRQAYIVSTTSMTLVLFLLGAVGYIMLNMLSAADRLKESMTVDIMLKSGVTMEQREAIEQNLLSSGMVRNSRFVGKEEAARDLKEYLGGDFEEFLDHNPLPDSYQINIKSDSSDHEKIADFEQQILGWDGVDEVVYQRGVVEQISANMGKFTLILLLFGGTLFVISLILLNNTIRVAIFARRYIIGTMKLVGATRGFIMRPFLIVSLRQGILAGVIASLMFLALIMGVTEGMPELSLLSNRIVLMIVGAMIVLGAMISFFFTLFLYWSRLQR